MKPESLLGISLELIEALARTGPYPADARVGRFFRGRRYLGSKDRRFIGDAAYAWLRHNLRARARWRSWAAPLEPRLEDDDEVSEIEGDPRLTSDAGPPEDSACARSRRAILRNVYAMDVLALARDDLFPWTFEETARTVRALPGFGEEVGPWKDLKARAASEEFLASTPLPEEPEERLSVECSLPRWLAERLMTLYGPERARDVAASLLQPASVDLRVNLRLSDRQETRAVLESEIGREIKFTPLSPLGLRLRGRKNLTATTASRRGWIEVQDEGSQISVLCADAAPGISLIDACAGSGGKTLAFADLMLRRPEISGSRIFACDVAEDKLQELDRRATETGLAGRIHGVPFYPSGPLPEELPEADLVFVDAPCTGFGTLRRNPELKRRYGPQDLASFAALQLSILERFAPLVKSGGRLCYVTCSFLEEECEGVVSAFAERRPEFAACSSEWAREHLPSACIDGNRIRLDPIVTRTDAFFIALWTRLGGS